jgi:hypothetical protein
VKPRDQRARTTVIARSETTWQSQHLIQYSYQENRSQRLTENLFIFLVVKPKLPGTLIQIATKILKGENLMKTISTILATTLVITLLCVPGVFACDEPDCTEYRKEIKGLLRLVCDTPDCADDYRKEIKGLLRLVCSDPDCADDYRKEIKGLLRLVCDTPDCLDYRKEIKGLLRLVCSDPDCMDDYKKDTKKLVQIASVPRKSLSFMGTSKAVKKPEEKNRLLEALDKADPDKFKTIRMLVEVGKLRKTAQESSTSLLMLASAKGDLEMVQELLGKGEDVKAQNKIGKTALIFAASEGHTKVVEALLKAGADPLQKDKDGADALTMAKKAGHEDVVKILEAKAGKK